MTRSVVILNSKIMSNNTSIIVSLFGGILLGSAITCIMHKKGCKIGREDIHKKIMEELDQLKNFVAAHHAEGMCSCEKPAPEVNNE